METTFKKIKTSHAGLTGSSHVRLTGWHNSTAYLALTSHTGLTGLLKKQSRWLDTINSITRVHDENDNRKGVDMSAIKGMGICLIIAFCLSALASVQARVFL
jgi:hypothetical protein